MPFTKITRGKNRGKYRSPSGRMFNRRQVALYYARGGSFDSARHSQCDCRLRHDGFTCDVARTARRDPSRTLDLRRGMIRDLERRWRVAGGVLTEGITQRDMFGLGRPSAQNLTTVGSQGGQVPAFQNFVDQTLAGTVLGFDRGEWMRKYVQQAYVRAWQRTARAIGREDLQPLTDRADLLTRLAVTELQGVMEVASQQMVRAMADGLMAHWSGPQIARLVRNRAAAIGTVRSRALAQFMLVRATSEATLDVMTLAGRTHVDVMPETLPSPGRRAPVRDSFDPDQPRGPDGKWESSGGSVVTHHGTSSRNLDNILQRGLRVTGNRRNFGREFAKGDRKSAVYVASRRSTAMNYAMNAAEKSHGDAAVLEVHVPKKDWRQFKSDLEHGKGAAYTNRNIPRKWIKRVDVVDGRTSRKIYSEKLRDAAFEFEQMTDGVIFLVVLLEDDSTFQDAATVDARRRRRVPLFEVLTAGDDLVCQECEDLADEGPYTLGEARGLIPAHPNCRCALVPADDERFSGDAMVEDEHDPVVGYLVMRDADLVPGMVLRDGEPMTLAANFGLLGAVLLDLDDHCAILEIEVTDVRGLETDEVSMVLPPGTMLQVGEFDDDMELWRARAWTADPS